MMSNSYLSTPTHFPKKLLREPTGEHFLRTQRATSHSWARAANLGPIMLALSEDVCRCLSFHKPRSIVAFPGQYKTGGDIIRIICACRFCSHRSPSNIAV